MKEIYMIYEYDWGITGIAFMNHTDAEKYIEMENDKYENPIYYIKPYNVYDIIEEYTANQDKESRIQEIKDILENLINCKKYEIKCKNGIIFRNYKEIENVVKTQKIDTSGIWVNGGSAYIKIVNSDIKAYEETYKSVITKINKYKRFLDVLENDKHKQKQENIMPNEEETLNR